MKTRERIQALIAAIQAAEHEAHALGMTSTGHVLNAAKNHAGWDATVLVSEGRDAKRYARKLADRYERRRGAR